MSQINKLIEKLCPNGVERKSLGDVCDFVNGFAFKSSLFRQSGSRIIRITNIDGVNINTVDSIYFDSNDYKEDLSKYIIKQGDIAIAMSGATTGKIGRYIDNDNSYINQRVGLFKPKQNLSNSYLYHLLLSKSNDIYLLAGGGAQPNLSSNSLMTKVSIPLPPLEIQNRIVEILDHFTNLAANLTAELTLRRKQFEHYSEKLFALEGVTGVERKTLGEIGVFIRGNGLQKSDFVDNGVGCIHYGQIHTIYNISTDKTVSFVTPEYSKKLRKAKYGDLIIATTSEDVEACCKAIAWLGNDEVAISGDSYIYRHNQDPLYISYLFQSESFQRQKRTAATGTKVVRVSGESMAKFSFDLPPLAVQKAIVEKLDKCRALIENIENEIKMRQKQYDYYREQLLTF